MIPRKRRLVALAIYDIVFWLVPWLTGPDAGTRILIAHTLLVGVGLIATLTVMAFGKTFMALVTWLGKRFDK